MKAFDQWKQIEAKLDPGWEVVRLAFAPEDVSRAAAVLAPLGPGRSGNELRFQVARRGAGQDRLENLLRRLDGSRVWGELVLVDAEAPTAAADGQAEAQVEVEAAPSRPAALAAQFDAEVRELPPSWRDAIFELELDSTDFLAQATLAGSPLNPVRVRGEIALRFRAVGWGTGGYGAPPELARRCLERMDEAGITGELRVVSSLEDVDYVYTQGPVFPELGPV